MSLQVLHRHPVVGALAPLGSYILSLLELLTPLLESLALLAGIIVACMTLLVKFQEWRIRSIERLTLEGEILLKTDDDKENKTYQFEATGNEKKNEPTD